MKKIAYFLLLFIIFISCKKQSELRNNFNCNVNYSENKLEHSDFNKNFKLNIPISWKTKLYYNQNQSQIFTADTLKQLTDTFILDASFNYGSLKLDSIFMNNSNNIIDRENFKKIKSERITFQNKPAYWYITKGEKNRFTYHQFNLTVIISENTYFTANVEIYGDTNINERICESIAIIDDIEFLQ